MDALLCSIVLEGVKFVFDLVVDILILAFAFSAFGFDNPNSAVFLFYDIIGIEQPLVTESVNIDDRKILLTGIAVFINPFNIITLFTMLFKEHFRRAANNAGSEARGIVMISI